MKNNLIISIIIAGVFGGAGFFGGMKYQESKQPKLGQLMMGGGGNRTGNTGNRTGNISNRTINREGINMPGVNGEITNTDNQTLTVKLSDGSSKIVILSENLKVSKTSQTDKSELKVGMRVAAFGQVNSDGSITAENIQLNPLVSMPQRTND